MKRILLLRHAKSSWDAPVARDIERPLNRRGRKAGKKMGIYMRAQALDWDLTLSSPAQRTRETITRLEKGYAKALDVQYDDRIYMASATQLFKLLKGLDDHFAAVMLLGHNPGLQGLALMVTPSASNPARDRLDAKYPTAALAVIDMPIKHWADMKVATGILERFVKPKDLPDMP